MVTFVTPGEQGHKADKFIQDAGENTWLVRYTRTDPETGEQTEHEESFDGVLVCSGRHGGGGFIPKYPNQDKFKGKIMHSSKYKYPVSEGGE